MKKRTGLFIILLAGIICTGIVFAEPFVQGMQPTLFNPQSMLVHSGVAFDASETVLGIVHVQEPRSFFKPDTKQVTWWGEFKPFKFWGNPELEAIWYAPPEPGEQHAKQAFKGQICVLAKSTLKFDSPPKEGKWRVDINLKGQQIDSKSFMIYSGAPSASVTSAVSVNG